MKKIFKHRFFKKLFVVLLSFIICLYFSQLNVAVGQINNETLQTVLSRLEQFKNQVSNMQSEVDKRLGPYPIKISCKWCSKKIRKIACLKTTEVNWETTVDFTWTRHGLSETLRQAYKNANTFSEKYSVVQKWLNTVPELVTKFDNVIQQVKEPRQDDIQRTVVASTMEDLIADLDTSSLLLERGTRDITSFLQQQSVDRDFIRQSFNGSERSQKEAWTNLQNFSKNLDCQYLVQGKYDEIKKTFETSLQEILNSFPKLEGSSREVEKILGNLSGSLVNSQTTLENVIVLVKTAQKDTNPFLQKARLNAAKRQIQSLANS